MYYLILQMILWARHYYYLYFIDGKTEIKLLGQSHTAGRWQSLISARNHLTPQAKCDSRVSLLPSFCEGKGMWADGQGPPKAADKGSDTRCVTVLERDLGFTCINSAPTSIHHNMAVPLPPSWLLLGFKLPVCDSFFFLNLKIVLDVGLKLISLYQKIF